MFIRRDEERIREEINQWIVKYLRKWKCLGQALERSATKKGLLNYVGSTQLDIWRLIMRYIKSKYLCAIFWYYSILSHTDEYGTSVYPDEKNVKHIIIDPSYTLKTNF